MDDRLYDEAMIMISRLEQEVIDDPEELLGWLGTFGKEILEDYVNILDQKNEYGEQNEGYIPF